MSVTRSLVTRDKERMGMRQGSLVTKEINKGRMGKETNMGTSIAIATLGIKHQDRKAISTTTAGMQQGTTLVEPMLTQEEVRQKLETKGITVEAQAMEIKGMEIRFLR